MSMRSSASLPVTVRTPLARKAAGTSRASRACSVGRADLRRAGVMAASPVGGRGSTGPDPNGPARLRFANGAGGLLTHVPAGPGGTAEQVNLAAKPGAVNG